MESGDKMKEETVTNIILAIIVALPLVGIVLYWYGVYCMWNGLLATTTLFATLLTLCLFVLVFIVGTIVSAILLVLFGILLSAALS